MARKRAVNGSGLQPRLRKDGRWECRYQTGINPGTGKAIYKSAYGRTAEECAKKLRAATADIDKGVYKEPEKMRLSSWLELWLSDYTASIKPGTLKTYVNNVKMHIVPAIGAVKLCDLQPHTIQQFIRALEKKQLSPKTIRNIHGSLHKALEEAARVGYLRANPADKTILPKVSKPEIKPLSGEEIDAFMAAIRGNPSEHLFFVAMWTGMRLSEILGLQWKCVNFERGIIRVDKQLSWKQKDSDSRELISTKNNKAREIKPPVAVMERLRMVRQKQAEWQLKAGKLWNNAWGLVFTDEGGNCLSQTTIEHRFKRVCQSIGLDRHFHDARHTFATEGIRLGIPVKTVSEALGHYSTAFTMDVYGHVTEEMQREAAEKLQASITRRESSVS